MLSLTSNQLSLLKQPDQECKAAVSIGITSPLRYCTGLDPVSISSNVYYPMNMTFEPIKVTSGGASASVTFEDPDGVIRSEWYSERFSGSDVTLYLLIRDDDGDWEQILSIPWTCTNCSYSPLGGFRVHFSGAAGLKPRAGLDLADRTTFSMAPGAGDAIVYGAAYRGVAWPGRSPQKASASPAVPVFSSAVPVINTFLGRT